jgi:CRISPR/Cas system-associated exonuclease Cas4 (RecB family)
MIDFDDLIDNYFSRTKKPKKLGNYYPSEIGSCLRKTYFSYKIPKDLDKDVLRIFEAGNNLHDLITDILDSKKNPHIELLETEMSFKQDEGEFTISGRIDNLILAKEHNKKILIEVKSTKFLPRIANDTHVSQLQLYMHNTGIHDGIVLYVQKDNLQTKAFNFKYNDKLAEDIIKRFHGLHHCLKLDILPPAEAKLIKDKNWMCNYCEYREECDKEALE